MKHLKIFLFCFSILTLVSCGKKFIALYPLDQANSGNSFNTPDDANLAVLGVYAALQKQGYPQDMALLTELITDNAETQGSRLGIAGAEDERELATYQLTDQNSAMEGRWTGLYKGISRANQIIDRIENIVFADGKKKDAYIGEAKFLRAIFYFDLVRFFGRVPISLNEIQSAQEAFALGRRPEEEVYEVIIDDLQEAIKDLPPSWDNSNLGRATEGAAKALLGKVYLTCGRPELALPLLRELTKPPYSYALMPTYADVFDNDNTNESLFEIQYTSSDPTQGNPYPQFFLPRDGTAGKDVFGNGYLGGNGNGRVLPTLDLWNDYEINDPRRDYTIAEYFSKQEGVDILRVNKYRGAPSSPNNSEDNIIILRYADVLLMLAEAINESGHGPTQEAFDAIDAVRGRVGLDSIDQSVGYEDFKKILLHERRVELAFENHRWFDLKRFGMALEILQSKGYAIHQYNLLFPIPRNEVEINKDLIDQNPQSP